MSTDESPDGDGSSGSAAEEGGDVRERLEREADRAVEQFDDGVVDLLSWVLDTETRARIYVYLRKHPQSTSDEVAEGTGLYPSTVREALAELHEEGKVSREKREESGAGNNPYEYDALAPSDLVTDVVEEVQDELNTVFNLDRYLGTDAGDRDGDGDTEAVTITVENRTGEASTGTAESTDERAGTGTATRADDADEPAADDNRGENDSAAGDDA